MKLSKKYTIILVIALVGVFSLIMGASYAFFTNTVRGKEYVIYSGKLAITYEKKTNVINMPNAKPMTNTEGLATTAYSFDVKNTGSMIEKYQVRLETDPDNTLPLEYVKISVYKDDIEYLKPTKLSDLSSTLVFVDNGLLENAQSDNYKVRLWADINTPNDMVGKEFKARVVIDAMQNVNEGYQVNTRPIITLAKDSNNNTHMNLLVGSTFTDPGVESIKDDKDTLLVSNITTTYEYFDGTNLTTSSGVDTNQSGVYYIKYSVLDNEGLSGTSVRVVTVNPTNIIPTITLNGSSTMVVSQGSTFTDPGVTVDNNIQVATIGEVKTTKVGTYIVRYIAIDSNNNMNSVTRTVNVSGVNLTGFALKIYQNSNIVTDNPTLTDESGEPVSSSYCEDGGSYGYDCTEIDEGGLYSMDVTGGYGGANGTTYYFRGKVDNNYVKFGKWTEALYYGYVSSTSTLYKRYTSLSACQNASNYNQNCTLIHDVGDDIVWRVLRINEDGTIRLILDGEANTYENNYNNPIEGASRMYYTNSTFKTQVDNWYNATFGNNTTYSSKIATGNYFCESARVKYLDSFDSANANMAIENEYLPDLACPTDTNNKGLVNSNVGLITYDELRLAGASQYDNVDYYLYKQIYAATMTPGGLDVENYTDDETGEPIAVATIWAMYGAGGIYSVYPVEDNQSIRPVINVKTNIDVTGIGTESDPYVIE